jgi:YidC/Oxa1 family membrane protein insertase
MNDIRRTILWVIFGFSMVLLWDQWQIHNGRQATFFPQPASNGTRGRNTAAACQRHGSSAGCGGSDRRPRQRCRGRPPCLWPRHGAAARELVVVSTDVLKLTFDSEGGSLVRTEFVKYKDMQDKNRNFVLLDESKERVYVAQTGLIGGSAGAVFPTHKTPMKVVGARDLKDGENELVLSFESPDVGGAKLVKTYTLRRGSLRHGGASCTR